MIKERKDAGTSRDKKEMAKKEKNNDTTWGNKPESTGERRKIKEIPTKGKTIQTKQDIPKQRQKILPSRRWHKNIPTTRCKRNWKLMTMHEALHPRDDIDRLYVSRKKGGRGHLRQHWCIDTMTRGQHKKHVGGLGQRLINFTAKIWGFKCHSKDPNGNALYHIRKSVSQVLLTVEIRWNKVCWMPKRLVGGSTHQFWVLF